MQNKSFPKKLCHYSICFFYHCTAKNKDIAKNVFLLFVCSFITNIPALWTNPKMLYLLTFIFERWKLLYLGGGFKWKLWKIRDSRRAFNLKSFGVFGLRFTLNLHILEAFKHLPFLPKMARHALIKTPFSKKNILSWLIFFWNFGGRRQIDAG